MGVQNPNSTAYEHPDEPNLLNLHKAMEYDDAGKPHVRVTLGSDNITITGDVNLVDTVSVNSTPEDPVHTHITEVGTSGILAVPYMPIQGTVSIGSDGTVSLSANTLSALENINATVSGTVELGATTLSALENTTVTISGTPTVNIGTIPEVEIKNDTGNPIPISATTAANSSVNPIYITGNVSTVGGSAQGKLWFFQIAQGLIAGHRAVFKAGYNPSIANNTEESLWSHSVIYPWASWGAGGTLSCASASASDVGTLYITGLKASDWTEVSEQVTLNGTTPVVTTNSFIRINSLSFSGADTNVGEIHVYRNGATVGYIGAGEGQGQMAQFSVPAGYTAYILNGNANMGKGNDGFGKFKYRMYGGSFQTAMTFLLFQSTFDYKFEAPLALPEKSDLDVTMLASVSGTACSCAYSLILIQNGL
jgi:hypothetical protein